MNDDTIHALIGLSGIVLIGSGSWLAWGLGYSLLVVGGILLAAVVFARRGAGTDDKPTD